MKGKLTAEEAVRRFLHDPGSMEIRLSDLLEALDMTFDELKPELMSGRLVGHLEVAPKGDPQKALREALRKGEVWFTGQAVLDWVATRQ